MASRNNAAFHWGVDNTILLAAYSFAHEGDDFGALLLMTSAMGRIEANGNRLVPCLRPDYERYHRIVLERISDEERDKAQTQGRSLTLEAAIDFAVDRVKNTPESQSK